MLNKSNNWFDFYRILQIDPLAEQEIVESAYKKLATKYHPDKNHVQNANEIMATINLAYDTLKNKYLRSQYDIKWLERQNISNADSYKKLSAIDEMMIYAAHEIIDAYFSALKERRFEMAYKLISDEDQKAISLEDFVRWQRSVSRVYKIIQCDFTAEQCFKRKTLHKNSYELVAAFKVNILEVNRIMKGNEVDAFTKYVVFEDGSWKIYVGHGSVHELIVRYERLSKLGRRNFVVVMKPNDSLLTNKYCLKRNALITRIEMEMERFNRYGNIFSVVVFEVKSNSPKEAVINVLSRQKSIELLVRDLITSIRKLDSVGFWQDNCVAVLLPETNLTAAMKFRDKMMELIEINREIHHSYKVKSLVIENEFHLLEDLLNAMETDTVNSS